MFMDDSPEKKKEKLKTKPPKYLTDTLQDYMKLMNRAKNLKTSNQNK